MGSRLRKEESVSCGNVRCFGCSKQISSLSAKRYGDNAFCFDCWPMVVSNMTEEEKELYGETFAKEEIIEYSNEQINNMLDKYLK